MARTRKPLLQPDGESGNLLTAKEWEDLGYEVSKVFTPASPISENDLFAGRLKEINNVIDAINQPGQHAIIYGERGVGKTSLANVLSSKMVSRSNIPALSPRINCTVNDTFSVLWRNVLSQITFAVNQPSAGFKSEIKTNVKTACEMVTNPSNITPDEVRQLLSQIGKGQVFFVIIDEFDRLPNDIARRAIADTIKTLSDYAVPATIIIVGVAETVGELIAEHQSIERALAQIQMPRMQLDELHEILDRGTKKLRMRIETDARATIARLSQGFPTYTHRLGLNAARSAIADKRLVIDLDDVNAAIKDTVANTQQSLQDDYRKAITSSQPNNLYERVLLACALAKRDQFGYFAAADVTEPLSAIMNKSYEIPSFAKHLKHFCDPDGGEVLKREGVARKYRYRFKSALMQPFVAMRGVVDGLIRQSEVVY
jgi:Cdc6-like AAA superfamily ATPase